MTDRNDADVLNRWRLILGKNAEGHIDFQGTESETDLFMSMESTLDFLYDMEYGDDIMRAGRSGGALRSP